MRSMHLAGSSLIEHEIPRPVPKMGEVLVCVHAAGIIPSELLWVPTSQNRDGSPRTSVIMSHEFSGVVEEVGAGVTEFSPGQEVYELVEKAVQTRYL